MQNARTPALAVLVLLAGGLGGCGWSSGSGGSDPPHDASRSSFCASLAELTASVSPQKAADTLAAVGTPSDIGSTARHGFEVLLSRLRKLPDHATRGDLLHMAGNLNDGDRQGVAAFVTYYAATCRGLPTAPAS